ncbi:hypothetical protein GGR51DRAFT_560624 [Nemania sp. FL0031]|nr:hypothetical protein GGR51DRAFT_560624 [Nemania sp. FL0031]
MLWDFDFMKDGSSTAHKIRSLVKEFQRLTYSILQQSVVSYNSPCISLLHQSPNEGGMTKKRGEKRPKVDYRHRWPTQQTLVESRISIKSRRIKRHWKLRVGWLNHLVRRASPEPGMSTHPYDTGVCWQGSGSRSTPTLTGTSSLTDDGGTCLTMFTRSLHTPHVKSVRTPIPRPSHNVEEPREEPRPDTPKTSIQLRRFLITPRNSPFPRARTASPFDIDKPAVKSTKHKVQTPAPLPEAERPVVKGPKSFPANINCPVKRMLRHRSLDLHDRSHLNLVSHY